MNDSIIIDNQLDIEFEDKIDDEISFSDVQIDFRDAVIWGTDWTLETIYRQISKGNIDLNPHFQRRDAWNVVQKSALIESFIIGLPVPPIILAEKKSEKGKYLILDGKQRLLSICQFCSDDSQDSQASQASQENPENQRFEQLHLKELQILKKLNGKTYNDLIGALSDYKDMFDNQTLRTVVIKNWPNEEFLYSIFLRLNTGMVKLSPQELRQSLHPGAFLSYLDKATATSKQFHRLLKNKNADPRMRDIELALRAFAWKFYYEDYRGDLKVFLDDACKKLNEQWEIDSSNIEEYFQEIEKAIDLAYEIFGDSVFSKPDTSRYAFNRALYEVFVYYFSNEDVRLTISEELKPKVYQKFKELYKNDSRFLHCISSSFSKIDNVEYRFLKIHDLISSITETELMPIAKLGKTVLL